MVWTTYTFVNIFQYKPGQVYFCTADIGWITGHSYIVYAPLCAGATSLMFEGIPTWPDAGRFWDIVERHQVNILYTAPTAIRSLMSYGDEFLKDKKLDSLQVLGTVGILISNIAGITPSKAAWATLPQPGILPVIVNEKGEEAVPDEDGITRGNLCIKAPWPGILRTTWGDHERCRQNYFSAYPGLYFTGDGCLKDEEGNYRITGRVDDVLNVSGHRIGTAEVENAINMHPGVIESAVVGFPHHIKGQGIYAFVIVDETILTPGNLSFRTDTESYEATVAGISSMVAKVIGPLAKPEKIQIVKGLPKTRSGKIMRRILRKIAEGEMHNLGDTSTLLDPAVVEEIKKNRV